VDDRSARHQASSVGVKPGRLLVILAAAVLASAQAGCGGGSDAPPVIPACTVTSVAVTATQSTFEAGGSSSLSATVNATAACTGGVTWSVAPSATSAITPNGTSASFTSATPGTYTVTARSVDDTTKSGSAVITVTAAPPVCVVTGVTVGASPAAVATGDTSTLTATLDATAACATGLTWSVSPTGGTLTPSGATATFSSATPGTYTVTATSDADTSRSGSATVTVTATPPVCTVAGVTVAATPSTFAAGGASSLTATLDATAACPTGLTWSVSPPTGGTLTPSGATASFASSTPGTYTITATSVADTGKSGSATITVTAAPPVCTVTSVSVAATQSTFEAGGTSSLSATVNATAACAGGVTWSVVPPTGGTLTPSGLTASFASATAGTYTITARSVDDTSRSGSTVITVTAAPPACIVTGVTVSANPATFEAPGTSSLTATVTATAQCNRTVAWTVSPDGGALTPSGLTASFASSTPGTYTITATSTENAARLGSATVTVTPSLPCTVSGLTLAAGPPAISTGGTSILRATLTASPACTRGLDWSVSAGGTLTPSGATTSTTASFTATTQAAYTVTVASLDDATRTSTATVTVGPAVACGQPNGSVITHIGGAVVTADETWVGDGVTHFLPGSVSISGTATVTIQPCAIVALGPIGSILVFDSGRLVSAGTGAGRFVEIGAASTGVRWGMISANGPGTLVDLRFTNVREGGETGGLPLVLSGIGAGDGAPPAPVLRVQSVEISGSGGLGVSLAQNATFTADSFDLIVKDSAGYPLRANLVALGTLPSGDYTQNAVKEEANEILVHGPAADLSTDMTIKNLGVPYRFEVPVVNVRPVTPAAGPVTLTIQPGVTLKFPRTRTGAPGALVSFGTAGLSPNGVGVLNAVGTALAPIVFTSGQDQLTATPAAGDWQGLWLATATGSQLDHVQIRYAGAPLAIPFNSGNCRPLGSSDAAALLVGNLSDQYVPTASLLTNSTIADSASHGINAVWDAATPSSGPDLTPNNTFLNLNGCRQTFNGVTTGTCTTNGCLIP
jgi:hypothetical protein